ISQINQSQTLGGKLGRPAQSVNRRPRGQRFVVIQIEVRDELPLRLCQLHARLLLVYLRLADLAATRSPVENRYREIANDVVAEIRQRARLRCSRYGAVQSERIRLNSIIHVNRK